MNFLKWILLTVFIHCCFCGGVYAQTAKKVSQFNIGWGIDYDQNYVKNPSARDTTNFTTSSNFNPSIGSANIEGATGYDLNATATSGYIEFTLNAFMDEDTVGNCVFSGYYNADGANYKAQIVDGSGVELNKFQLSNVTAWTPFAVVYPCGATGARKVRFAYTSTGTGAVFRAGKLTYKKYDDISVPDGASFFGGMEQVGAAGCNYTENTSSSATNFVDLGAGTGCSAWTVTGKVLATGTNDHRPILVTPGPGHYQVVINAGVYGKASGTCVWRLTDGTTTFPAQQQYSNSGQNLIPSLIFNITYSAQQASNMTLKVQAADDQATGCELNNGLTSAAMSWKIYKFPLNGTAYSNVIPASCINNPDCQNNFSATVSASGVVSKEDFDFVNGNAVISDTSLFTFTLSAGRFGDAPKCGVEAIVNSTGAMYNAMTTTEATTTTVIVRTGSGDALTNFTKTPIGFILRCSRSGTDVKPWGPIPLLSGMTSSNAPGNEKLDTAKLSCATASSKLIDRGNLVTSISNRSADKCTIVVNGYSAEPQCFLMPIDGGSSTIKLRWFSYSHTGTTTTMVSACAFGAADGVCGDQIYNLFCDGPR